MNLIRLSIALLTFFAGSVGAMRLARSAEDADPKDKQGSQPTVARYLLLDSRIVDETENVTLTVGTVRKHPRNPLFGEDKPWEPRYDNMYPNVIYDREEKLYKCWYTPFVESELDENTPRERRKSVKWNVSPRRFGLCYAVSEDGLKWQKPELGLVELRGSKKNNILLFDVHGADVIKDERETDPARRYKMFGTVGGLGPHMVWFSPDGLNWSEPITLDLGGRADTHNNVFWCPDRNEFVGITRFGFPSRTVGRTSSPDFVHWSPVEEVLTPEPGQADLHDMIVMPYAGIYLGLIGVYDVPANRQWVELAWSSDTRQWHRVQPGTPLIANASKQGDYDWGCIFATRPIVGDKETLIYYAGCNGKFFDWRDGFLCLATLPNDRWAGYRNDGSSAGSILTQPLECRTANLLVTADATGGSVVIEVLDERGNKIAQSKPLVGDLTDEPVVWESAGDLRSAIGKRVRLRLKPEKATIYSFAFAE